MKKDLQNCEWRQGNKDQIGKISKMLKELELDEAIKTESDNDFVCGECETRI